MWDNGEVSSYTNWHAEEPNNDNLDENFAMYYFKFSDGSWNDGDFGKQTDRGNDVYLRMGIVNLDYSQLCRVKWLKST